MTENESKQFETGYEAGRRASAVSLMRSILGDLLGEADKERPMPALKRLAQMTVEREEAVAVLRLICRAHGDLDWEPSLHLADIIDKHLGKHLE